MIVTTAPGKLFLTGEWAVLHGAPAVVGAVDRTARVELDATAGSGELTVESLAEGRRWQGDPAIAALPDGDAGAVVAAVRATGALHGRVVVDSRAFLVGERKLGLGRSAATLAAATAACRALARAGDDRAALLRTALAANALFQDGVGSGADVAAAVYGGVIEARRAGDGLAVAPRVLPAGLHLIAGWTGESASTAPLVARFTTRPVPPVLAELIATAEDAAAAVARGSAAELCALADRSADLLARLGDETGLPIVSPGLRRLIDAARRAGAVAKPSGAGGGDCGIAFATSPTVVAAVRAAWRAAGILPLEVGIAGEGVAGG